MVNKVFDFTMNAIRGGKKSEQWTNSRVTHNQYLTSKTRSLIVDLKITTMTMTTEERRIQCEDN